MVFKHLLVKIWRIYDLMLQLGAYQHHQNGIFFSACQHSGDFSRFGKCFADNNLCPLQNVFVNNRLEICRDCHDRQSCKFFSTCVNFSRKQCVSLHLCRNIKFTHLFGKFTHIFSKRLKSYKFNSISTTNKDYDHQC